MKHFAAVSKVVPAPALSVIESLWMRNSGINGKDEKGDWVAYIVGRVYNNVQ